jgi:hypothetical protein
MPARNAARRNRLAVFDVFAHYVRQYLLVTLLL